MRILWIGDGGTSTGFSRVCHEIGERLVVDYGHQVDVLAVGYDGKRPINTPLRLWAAGKAFGFDRVQEIVQQVDPEVVITNEDIPFVLRRLFDNPWDKEQMLYRGPWRILSYIPLDGDGLPADWYKITNFVDAIPYTKFAADQLGLDDWVYHGVDTEIFHPPTADNPIVTDEATFTSREELREFYKIPPDAFVIGRVDTNSGRKDWPNNWRVIEKALPEIEKDRPVRMLWHTRLKQASHGVNLSALFSRGRGTYHVTDASDLAIEDVAGIMAAAHLCVTTTRGEGFGLTYVEYLACGVPVLGSRHSVMEEVLGPGAVLVDPSLPLTTPYGHDLRLPDVDTMAQQLVQLAREPERLESLGLAGLEHVRRSFSWDTAARKIHERSLGEVPDAVVGVQSA